MQYIPTIALVLSALGVAIASLSLRHNRNLARLQIVEQLMTEYRSADMLAALTRLHRLRDYCDRTGANIKDEYDRQFSEDQALLAAQGNSKEAIEYSAGTLHNQRRLVSHFYNRMYWLIVHGALPAGLVFSYWNPGALDRIFNRILIPIRRDPVEWLTQLYAICLSASFCCSRSMTRVAIAYLAAWAAATAIVLFMLLLDLM